MTSLKKVLDVPQGTAITIGAVLGTGVLVLPALAAHAAGPASLVSWVLMALMSLPFALTFGQLAARFPDAGGIAAFVRRAFGDRLGFAAGTLFLGTVPMGAPVAGLIGGAYVSTLFGWPSWTDPITASVILAISLWLNYRGIELSARAQVLAISGIALILLASVVATVPFVRQSAFTPFAPHGWAPVGLGVVMLFWAFVGWEMTTHLAEEFRHPARDLPRVMILSLIVIDIVYLAVAFVTVGSGAYHGTGQTVALAVMMGMGFGHWAEVLTGVLAALISFATSHAYNAGFSRLVYAQARHGDFPRYFGHLHPRFHSPDRVTVAMGIIFFLVFLATAIFHMALVSLILYVSGVFVFLYVLAMAAGIWLSSTVKGKVVAALGLLPTVLAIPFLGTAFFYPGLILATGLWAFRFRTKSERNGDM